MLMFPIDLLKLKLHMNNTHKGITKTKETIEML